MSQAGYFRKRRENLIARGLCIDCRKKRSDDRVRCDRCAKKNAEYSGKKYVRRVIIAAPKTSARVDRMMKLAELLIPPSRVGIEDIHRRKESA